MKFRIRYADQVVGVFILIAVLGIAGFLVLLGANQRWFARNYLFWSRFASAEGLSTNMAIKLKGFQIGKVASVSLTRNNLVDIEFLIYDTYYDRVLPNSVLELSSNPLGLGGGLQFHPGKGPGEPLPEFSFIPSMDLPQGQKLMAGGLVEAPGGEDVIGSTLARLGPVLQEVQDTLEAVQQLAVSLDGSIKGTMDSPLSRVMNDLAATTARVNGVLDRMDAITADLQGISANLRQTTDGMKDPTGLARKLLDPQGSVATILDDDNALYDQILQSLEQLTSIIRQLQEFTKFVNSTQPQIAGILEEGRQTLDQGKDVLQAVKNNPLLRGGIPKRKEQPTTFQGFRDRDF